MCKKSSIGQIHEKKESAESGAGCKVDKLILPLIRRTNSGLSKDKR
jgi:hypothetical protein